LQNLIWENIQNLAKIFFSIALFLFLDSEKFLGISALFTFFGSGILVEKFTQKYKKEIFSIFSILIFCSTFSENVIFNFFLNFAFIGFFLKKFCKKIRQKLKINFKNFAAKN